jgi:ribose transport system permease protein
MKRLTEKLLELSTILLLGLVVVFFSSRSSKFLEGANLANIAAQSASTGIVTIGMTFVLLTGGVDLSVGAIMFLAAALAGKLALAGIPVYLVLATMLVAGLLFGCANGLVITKLRVVPFIVTLATLFIGRGTSLWITKTRAMNLPEIYLEIGSTRFLGIPFPAWLFAFLLILGHLFVTRTPFGRQILALGHDPETARRAGIRSDLILTIVYVLSGSCAAVAAIVSLGQLGAVSPKFGEQKEFAAIAAAVLGGTSLFGGRGSVLPGALLGSILIQTIENGLVIINADPYLYPLVTSGIIFVAIALDGFQKRLTNRSLV